jgi:hypothetical protein
MEAARPVDFHRHLIVAFAYIGARLAIHEFTERKIARAFASTNIMASPNPIDPFRWDFVARTGDTYRFGRFHWLHGMTVAPEHSPSPNLTRIRRRERAPTSAASSPGCASWYEIERTPTQTRVLIHDARYAVRRRAGGGFGGVEVVLPAEHPTTNP